MEEIIYFDIQHAIAVHDAIIEKSGGRHGLNDIGLLESVLSHVQNEMYYPDFLSKLSHLCYSINKAHAFTDGNKRASIALSAYFLELNGYDYCVSKFIQWMENIAVDVADNRIDKELLTEIIESIIYDYEFSDKLKMKIIDAKGGLK
jgi:death on curing protein